MPRSKAVEVLGLLREEVVDLVEVAHRSPPGASDLGVPAVLLFVECVVAEGGPLAQGPSVRAARVSAALKVQATNSPAPGGVVTGT
jgi:hypothetical protein